MESAWTADRGMGEWKNPGLRVWADACMADPWLPDGEMRGRPTADILGRLTHGHLTPDPWMRGRLMPGYLMPDAGMRGCGDARRADA